MMAYIFTLSSEVKAPPKPLLLDREIASMELQRRLDTELEEAAQSLRLFMMLMAFKESSNNPDTINSLGYIGKYSFGRQALQDIGISLPEKFFRHPGLWAEEQQDKAFLLLTIKNRHRLRPYIDKYKGKVVRGIRITEAGLLAGAHLSGYGGVKEFLNGSSIATDAYGTSIADYIRDFSHIDVGPGIDQWFATNNSN